MRGAPISLLLLATLAASLLSPAAAARGSPRRPLVLVSVEPLASIVRDVAGDLVDVAVAIPGGEEPHSFQATPELLDLAGEASLFVTLAHLPVEEQLSEVVDCPVLGLEDYRVRGLRLLQMPGGQGEDIHGFWLLPGNAEAIAAAVAEALEEIDPDHAAEYRSRLERFEAELASLKEEISELSESLNLRGQKVVVSTPAEVYAVSTLGMIPVSSIVKGPNAMVGPRELSELGAAMDRGEVRYVSTSDAAAGMKAGDYAVQLAADHGAPLIRFRILSAPASYLAYVERNLGLVEGALSRGDGVARREAPGLDWECAAWVAAAAALAVAASGVAIWRA